MSRLDTVERISELEDIVRESSKTKKQREQRLRRKKKEQTIQGLWDNYKRWNIHIVGVQEGEGEKGRKEISETIMTENFPNLVSDAKPQIQ